MELAVIFSAAAKFDRANQDTSGQVVAENILDAVLLEHLCFEFCRVPSKAGVDLDSPSNLGLDRPVLSFLDATHDRFGVGLANAESTQILGRLVN